MDRKYRLEGAKQSGSCGYTGCSDILYDDGRNKGCDGRNEG
jgi:hypothetical protein